MGLDIVVISCILLVIVIALIIAGKVIHKTKEGFSFKSAFKLTGLPVLLFEQDNTVLKFILDTGSSVCVLDESSISKLKDFKYLDKQDNLVDVNGGKVTRKYGIFKFKCENIEFENEFLVSDLTNIRESVKEDSGISIDGIVGSDFFSKYQYIIDFDKYLAYSKKRKWSLRRR